MDFVSGYTDGFKMGYENGECQRLKSFVCKVEDEFRLLLEDRYNAISSNVDCGEIEFAISILSALMLKVGYKVHLFVDTCTCKVVKYA